MSNNTQLYLTNEICNFKPLFNVNNNEKKDCIFMSFFKINNPYKNFDIYINRLYNTHQKLNKTFPSFRQRMFIDQHIYNDRGIMNKLTKLNIDLILFQCSQFMENNFHIGLFGTMVRFFPMFDFDNNDTRFVLISDVDNTSTCVVQSIFHNVDINILKKMYFFKIGDPFRKRRFLLENDDPIGVYSNAQAIGNYKKIDKECIINFLFELLNSDIKNAKKYSYFINNFDVVHKNFIYGCDEYFINNTLVKYLNSKKYPYCTKYEYDIYTPLYYDIKNKDIQNSDDENFLVIKIIRRLLRAVNLKYDANKSISDNYEQLDNIWYIEKKVSDLCLKLFYKYYKILIKIYKKYKKEYDFIYPDNFYKRLFSKELFGYFNYHAIIFSNIDNINNINLIQNKLSDKQIGNLLTKLKDK